MILAINSASEKVSIAIYQPGKIESEVSWESYRTQSREILPEIDKLFKKNNCALCDLTCIYVNSGPGSFTGLRVGISIANSIGYSLNIPVYGIKNKNSGAGALELVKRKHNISSYKIKKFLKPILPYYNSPLK